MVMSRYSGKETAISRGFSNAVVANMVAAAQPELLPNAPLSDPAAPKSLTGCVSAISTCAAVDHNYTDALKNYAEVYEEFQAYLSPPNTVEHDYDRVIAMSVPEHSHFGCLNDEMANYLTTTDVVSDDDIENCGYLGWLHR